MIAQPIALAPEPTEFAPYYGKYIGRVKSDNIVASLEAQGPQARADYGALTEAQADFRFAPDKWSVKQMLGHVIDAERVFSYRALCIARGDRTPLPSFEQDDYVRNGSFEKRTLAELIDEFAAVRHSTVLLLRSFDAAAWTRRGTASNNEVSVRAIAYIIAGHELHHIEMLREKYLPALKASR